MWGRGDFSGGRSGRTGCSGEGGGVDLTPSRALIEPYGFVFPMAVSLAEVIAALNRLDPVEVERVFRVNDPG